MRRRGFLALALLAPAAARAELPPSVTPVAALNDALLAIMRAGRGTPFTARLQMLQPVVERVFDLPQILQSSVGPRWASFRPPQQEQLLDVFTQFTVASWAANFDSYDGQTFEILPELRRVGSDEVVQTRMVPRSGDPARLDYVMRQNGDAWKVIDILLDGSISRVAVQRSDFRSLLTGGDPTLLIASLRDKVATLAIGAKS
ncbi:ABC transporter substrate-binding protein [Limobrevibacterium gyesilva]|uniref:ABC transporter substrate-binding protein n=1 Tax=Limobrevibacterium gyesilva TaxID=2991712 RepID=A0AA41YQX2_9PROT|nr:ABC transporter substrate-binding protein [Limobrevibacterium gyesilva]MCW3476932.1 ABC transporter substrate-binding protein [Limobrevibacterium gyesilva]